MSISSWGRNCLSTGLDSITLSSRSLSASRRWPSSGSLPLSAAACRTSPSAWLGSAPPPGITWVLVLLFLPPAIATFSGILNWSAMPSSCLGDEMLRIHSTRKKANMAVMKSANAIFQAPPWWAAAFTGRRMTMILRAVSLMEMSPGCVGQPPQRALTSRTWPSSSVKDGRSVEYKILRPNSTASCGA